jgi:N-acetylglucosamine-6-phosphate deacetylase
MRLLIDNALICDSASATFERGRLVTLDGIILPPDTDGIEFDFVLDAGGAYLIPGLVDIHTHGRAGNDFCYAGFDELGKMAKSYLKSGVTTVMPTLATAPFDELLSAADRINAARDTGGARFVGLHLEGRYINPGKRGAQSERLLSLPDTDELDVLVSRAGLPFHVTFAPELDPGGEFLSRVLELGGSAAAGHTMMTYAQARAAEQSGITVYSHLFNAMPPLHHRAGGVVCAALTGSAFCELICDGIHISPEMIRLAYRCLGRERTVLVSDSSAGTGCPDGHYRLAGVQITVKDGRALTADGALAGSTLDLFRGMLNLMKFCDIQLEEAVVCATQNPARAVGIDNLVGSLEPGKYADALLLRPDKSQGYTIERIILAGKPVNI